MNKKINLQNVKNLLKHLDVKLFISDYDALDSFKIKMCDKNTDISEPECLYICKSSNLPNLSNIPGCVNVICLQDTKDPESCLKNSNINLLLIEKDASLSILFNLLQDILNLNINSKTSALIDSVIHGKGLQNIINLGYELLGNPFVMIDLCNRLLANTPNTVSNDILWNEIIINGVFSHETAYFFYTEKFVEDFANTESTILMQNDKLKYDRIGGKIFDTDGKMIASITVVGCYKPFTPDDHELIRLLCEMISIELQNSKFYEKLESIYHETFICELIDGKITDKNIVYERIENLYINLKENLFIAAIDITRYDHSHLHLSYLRELFEETQSEFKYFIYRNNIVMLISTHNTNIDIKKDLYVLYKLFRKYNIYAGISNSFQNLFEIRKYYKQALNALNYGMEVNADEVIFKYDDYKIDYLLNHLINEPNTIELCCHPIVFTMQKYDIENGTSYADMLYNYFQSGMNTRLASKKMNIEHEFFCKNLNKIEDIFGIDRNNGNLLLNLFISFKFLKRLSPLPQ